MVFIGFKLEAKKMAKAITTSLKWLHNKRDGVSAHQPHECLLNRLFRHRLKETSKPRVTGNSEGNSAETGELPTQRAISAENVSIWWRHHEYSIRRFQPSNIQIICIWKPKVKVHTGNATSHLLNFSNNWCQTIGYKQLWNSIGLGLAVFCDEIADN